jgi:hypothetical protein
MTGTVLLIVVAYSELLPSQSFVAHQKLEEQFVAPQRSTLDYLEHVLLPFSQIVRLIYMRPVAPPHVRAYHTSLNDCVVWRDFERNDYERLLVEKKIALRFNTRHLSRVRSFSR